MNNRWLYVGTYTRPTPTGRGKGSGLYVFAYDEGSGVLSLRHEVTEIENPSYLCVSPDGQNLHSVWEVLEWSESLISSYAIDAMTGELSYLGVQGSRGTLACYLAMDSQSRAAFASNYLSGSVTMFPVRPDGRLAEAASIIQHAGSGPIKELENGPHAHCVVVDPADEYVFSADLGVDAVFGYRIDYEHGVMIPHSCLALPPGSGPRHLVFSPDGRHCLVLTEMASTIAALNYEAGDGTLALTATYPMLPHDFEGTSEAADIRVHPSGRFVYGSNRGHDSIVMFCVDQATGRLELLGHRSSEGASPRNFAISPDGQYLLVANEKSDSIVTMPIDQDTGLLGTTSSTVSVPTPVCLKFGM